MSNAPSSREPGTVPEDRLLRADVYKVDTSRLTRKQILFGGLGMLLSFLLLVIVSVEMFGIGFRISTDRTADQLPSAASFLFGVFTFAPVVVFLAEFFALILAMIPARRHIGASLAGIASVAAASTLVIPATHVALGLQRGWFDGSLLLEEGSFVFVVALSCALVTWITHKHRRSIVAIMETGRSV